MKKVIVIIMVFVCFVALTGFRKSSGPASVHGEMGAVAGHDGITVQVLAVEGYTYVELESGGEKTWIAAPSFKVEKGDRVLASKGIEMRNYHSRFLDRTFPVVWFVGTIEVVGKDEVAVESKNEKPKEKRTVHSPVIGSIKKIDGGYSLEEIFARKKALSDKEVKFRAKVVKASGSILGSEWYHVQDGTGADAKLDLIVISKDKVEAGSVVVVTGTLLLDRDYGSGYRYDIIVENASLKVE